MDKITGQCPQTTTFLNRKESRSKRYRTEVLPLTSLTIRPDRLENSCRCTALDRPGVKGQWSTEHLDRLAGKAILTSGLLLGRSKVLRSLRHYLRAQSQGHRTTDRLEERGVERGISTRRSSLKGRERAIVNLTNIGTVSRATLGTLLRDMVSAYGLFRVHRHHLELN